MAKYQRKPEYIEAIQWTGNNWAEIKDFAQDSIGSFNGCLFLHTSGIEGRIESMVVNETDYIIKGKNGFRSMDKRAFEALYMPVEMKQNKEV